MTDALALALSFGLLVAFLLALRFMQRSRNGQWLHEDERCACGHDWYDHMDSARHRPCAALMCACPHFYKKEN